jgi:hypothetical protein
MNWYIGQEIVAVKGHSQGCFKKGDEFIIRGLKKQSFRVCFLSLLINTKNSTHQNIVKHLTKVAQLKI